jgi:hypothetical protein
MRARAVAVVDCFFQDLDVNLSATSFSLHSPLLPFVTYCLDLARRSGGSPEYPWIDLLLRLDDLSTGLIFDKLLFLISLTC